MANEQARRRPKAEAQAGLQALIAERLQRLSSGAQRLIGCAALLGYRIDAALLAQCAGATFEATLAALRAACELDLISAETRLAAQYRFRHALTQAAIANTLGDQQKRNMHAEIARALELVPDADARLEQLAHHWSLAGKGAKAAAYRRRSGEDARPWGTAGRSGGAR